MCVLLYLRLCVQEFKFSFMGPLTLDQLKKWRTCPHLPFRAEVAEDMILRTRIPILGVSMKASTKRRILGKLSSIHTLRLGPASNGVMPVGGRAKTSTPCIAK